MKNADADSVITSSEPMNQILELAERVAQEQAQSSDLAALLEQRIERCLEFQVNFQERGESRGERFLDEHGAVLEQVILHLQHCESGLRQLLKFCQSGDLQDLIEAREVLLEVTDPLKGIMEYYGQLYMTYGPSDYPLMNTICLTLNEILEGKRPSELLKAVTANAIAYHELGIKEMEESSTAVGEGFQAKKKAYLEVILALRELKPVQSSDQIEKASRPLQLALESITLADEKILNEHLGRQPTNMPSANIVINVFKGGLTGDYPPQQLRDTLEWYQHVAADLEDQFELAVLGQVRSAIIRDEVPRFRQHLDHHYEVLEDLQKAAEASLSGEADEELEDILQEFAEVVEELSESAQVFVDAAEREGKITCVKCAHPNPLDNRNCGECGFRLPKVAGMSTTVTLDLKERAHDRQDQEDEPPYVLGENTYRLLEAAGLFHEGSIDEETFQALLDESRRMVESSDGDVEDYKIQAIPPEAKTALSPEQLEELDECHEVFHDAKELLQIGIDMWLEALDLFEEYIETRHYPLVERGCDVLFHASQKMHEVSRLGESTGKALESTQPDEEESGSIHQPLDTTGYSTMQQKQ